MVNMDRLQLGWVAGLLEGEGCFISVGKSPVIGINMTDRDIIEKVRNILAPINSININRKSRNNPKHKDTYAIQVYGIKAVGWMMTLYSLMGQRRKAKIKEVIATWRTTVDNSRKTHCKNGHEFSKENTYITSDGFRSCKTCAKATGIKTWQTYKQRKSEVEAQNG